MAASRLQGAAVADPLPITALTAVKWQTLLFRADAVSWAVFLAADQEAATHAFVFLCFPGAPLGRV